VLHQVPVSTYDQNMRTNARGAFLGCKYAISQMLKQKVGPTGSRGWIVNIASSAGLVGVVGLREYSFETNLPYLLGLAGIVKIWLINLFQTQLPTPLARVRLSSSRGKLPSNMDNIRSTSMLSVLVVSHPNGYPKPSLKNI
jgi:NAD(P)-dependent dehydrogenase (short-subunit alcohol dehydrogenase family)